MSSYQKIKKMIKDIKKNSILHSLKSATITQDAPCHKDSNPTLDSQSAMKLFPLMNLTDWAQKKSMDDSQEDKLNQIAIKTPKTKQKSELKGRKTVQSVSFRIQRKGKEEYLQTLSNVSSMLTNPIGTKLRINKFNDKTLEKAYKTMSVTQRVISLAETPAPIQKVIKCQKIVKTHKEKISPKKFRRPTARKMRPASSPFKRVSPLRKCSISAWQTPEQSQISPF